MNKRKKNKRTKKALEDRVLSLTTLYEKRLRDNKVILDRMHIAEKTADIYMAWMLVLLSRCKKPLQVPVSEISKALSDVSAGNLFITKDDQKGVYIIDVKQESKTGEQ